MLHNRRYSVKQIAKNRADIHNIVWKLFHLDGINTFIINETILKVLTRWTLLKMSHLKVSMFHFGE